MKENTYIKREVCFHINDSVVFYKEIFFDCIIGDIFYYEPNVNEHKDLLSLGWHENQVSLLNGIVKERIIFLNENVIQWNIFIDNN